MKESMEELPGETVREIHGGIFEEDPFENHRWTVEEFSNRYYLRHSL